ncbi:MAG: response regulator [Nanoarchaeota archaeon]|nr:response regulator [Nanoarchaeota archaeon]
MAQLNYFSIKMAEDKRKLKALLVEDDAQVRQVLVEILSNQQLDVTTANDGEEAYRLISAQRPDIIITDIIMPRMHGYELLEKLVQGGVKIPTFVISASSSDERAAATIYHSHRMYTDEQARELKLPLRQAVSDVRAYIDNQVRRQLYAQHQMRVLLEAQGKDAQEVGRYVNGLPYNFGFNVLTKPFNIDELIAKIRRVQGMLYK